MTENNQEKAQNKNGPPKLFIPIRVLKDDNNFCVDVYGEPFTDPHKAKDIVCSMNEQQKSISTIWITKIYIPEENNAQ